MAFTDYNGPYHRMHCEGEKGFGPSQIEPGESLPTRLLVERFMNAGVARQVHNALVRMYEFGPGDMVPDGFIGPRGRMANDIVDVTNLRRWVEARIRNQKELAAEIAAKAKADREAEAAVGAAAPESEG